MSPGDRMRLDEHIAALESDGAPRELARTIGLLEPLTLTLGLVEAGEKVGVDLTFLTATFSSLGAELQVDWLLDLAAKRPADDHWSILARLAVGDDLVAEQQRLALAVLHEAGTTSSPEGAVAVWLQGRRRRVALFEQTVRQLRAAAEVDVPMLTVALEGLRSLQGAGRDTDHRLP